MINAAGDGGDSRVLRIEPAFAVHGPDQSAVGDHAQEALSALGPGGLSRERAGFEVRDVHPTHWPHPVRSKRRKVDIGLISSLSCFARINEYGSIESPYRKVKDSRILDYVEIANAGGERLRVGDHIEKEEAGRLNASLKKAASGRSNLFRQPPVAWKRTSTHHRPGEHRIQRQGRKTPRTW